MPKQQTLAAEVQTFIIQALACYDPPSAVVKAVKDEFGLVVTRQRVEAYDPNKVSGRSLSDKHRKLFEETRKAFLENTAAIAISHRAVRLRSLQRMAEKAENMGNMPLAAQLYEQAAKEIGDHYTNRRVLSSPGGGAPFQIITPGMTPKEAADAYADMVRGDG